jgi:lysozyme
MPRRKKKNILWKFFLLLLLASISVMTWFTAYDWWMERRAHFVRYPEFGIDIPVNYAIHGIDVSKYQNIIDWQSVKDMDIDNVQINFVFIKATEGLNDVDGYFTRNWRKAKDAGLTRGAYHYFLATKSGKEQAENFINSVKLETGDMPPVLDIEQTYGVPLNILRDRMREWLETIQNYYGVMPIIYTNVEFYKQVLKDDFDLYPLWVAHYLQKQRPRIYRNWTFWQHDEGGRVNGVFTKVDFNVFNGDSADFRKLLIN